MSVEKIPPNGTTKLTANNQITIPQEVRDELELSIGDKFRVLVMDDGNMKVVQLND